MQSPLVDRIDSFRGQVDALDTSRQDASFQQDVEHAVAYALFAMDRLERLAESVAGTGDAWREENARKMIPAFQRWHAAATKTRELVIDLKARGVRLEQTPPSMHACLRGRMWAERFDEIQESFRQLEERATSRPAGGRAVSDPYRIEFTDAAQRVLNKLPPAVRARVDTALAQLEHFSIPHSDGSRACAARRAATPARTLRGCGNRSRARHGCVWQPHRGMGAPPMCVRGRART